ncbi:hypothetical protein LJC34_03005 [Oscillospiraceae bacterium OttesenSCG-928-G22]|nr:hypothetical protein [Oscillospiraceae bacterium OttesenSCG-928-G22]
MKKRIIALLLFAALMCTLTACNENSPFTRPTDAPEETDKPSGDSGTPAAETYYNGFLGLSVEVPEDWRIEDIDDTTMTATADESKDIDAFNSTDFGDGGYGISLIDIWSRDESSDDDHVGLWLFVEDYRELEMEEEEYYNYFDESYGGESQNGFLSTLESREKVTVGGQQYVCFNYKVTHADNKSAYYSDYYVRPINGVYFVMNVTYWEDSAVGIKDAERAVEELVTFSESAV